MANVHIIRQLKRLYDCGINHVKVKYSVHNNSILIKFGINLDFLTFQTFQKTHCSVLLRLKLT